MKLAIMQPYFFPYVGYFQLMNAVDQFVIYDNIQFSKAGWIHRNRILVNGKDSYITLSLKKDLSCLDVRDRFLSDNQQEESRKLLRRIEGCYQKAPYYKEFFPVIQDCMNYPSLNLFEFVLNTIHKVACSLSISTPIVKSSEIDIDHTLRGQDKVIALCKHLGASVYINPQGGQNIYDTETFRKAGIDLRFIVMRPIPYKQRTAGFVPYLSIIDALMELGPNEIKHHLDEFDLIVTA